MFSISHKQEQAHEASIWSCDWRGQANLGEGNDFIVTGGLDDAVKIWKWEDNSLNHVRTMAGHQLGVVSVKLSPDLNIVASSGLDSKICLWDLKNGEVKKTIDPGPGKSWTVDFSPDGHYVATGSHSGVVNIFNIESDTEDHIDTMGKFTLSIAYSPDNRYIACGAIDGIITVYDTSTGKLYCTFKGHALSIRSLSFSHDSTLLISGSDDHHIKVYDIQQASLVCSLSGHASWVLGVDFTPNNNRFASCSSDKTVKVWDLKNKQCEHTFNEHTNQVWDLHFNEKGDKLVTVSEDQNIIIFDCPI